MFHKHLPHGEAPFFLASTNNKLVVEQLTIEEEISNETRSIVKPNYRSITWTNKIIHVVSTRFMQGQSDLVHLTRARLQLFETFCLPSIIGQDLMQEYLSSIDLTKSSNKKEKNLDPPFIWIIKIDPHLEKQSLLHLIQLCDPYPNIYLVSNAIYGNDIGRWRNDVTIEKILNGPIHSGELQTLHRAHQFRNDFIFVETRLDADDALDKYYLHRIQEDAIKSLRLRHEDKRKPDWIAYCTW